MRETRRQGSLVLSRLFKTKESWCANTHFTIQMVSLSNQLCSICHFLQLTWLCLIQDQSKIRPSDFLFSPCLEGLRKFCELATQICADLRPYKADWYTCVSHSFQVTFLMNERPAYDVLNKGELCTVYIRRFERVRVYFEVIDVCTA